MLSNKIILFFLNTFSTALLFFLIVVVVIFFEALRDTGSLTAVPRAGKEVYIAGLVIGFIQAISIQFLLWRQRSVSFFFLALSTFMIIETYFVYVSIPIWTNRYYATFDLIFAVNGLWQFLFINFVFVVFALCSAALNKFLINCLVSENRLV